MHTWADFGGAARMGSTLATASAATSPTPPTWAVSLALAGVMVTGGLGLAHAGGMARTYSLGRQFIAWGLVGVQMLLLAGLVWLPGDRRWSVPVWVAALGVAMVVVAVLVAVAAAAGLGAGLTASPLPARAARLRTTGMYRWVRHPIYSALLLGGAGVVVLGGRVERIWLWLALLAVLLVKTRLEEAALKARFPDYPTYAARTPRLVPSPLRSRPRS